VQRAAELAGKVAHQPLLGRAELAFRRPVGQAADGRAVGLQGNGGAGAGSGAGYGGAVEAADADVAQVQAGGELGDGGVEQAVDVGGGFQPLAQIGQNLVRLVPAAVDDAGDRALQGFAQRDEQQRGDGRRERGGSPGVMVGNERGGGDHHDGVDADDGA
jgi:hypothetical protein